MTHRRHILLVTSSFPMRAGDSTAPFILHLAHDLQALGWRVDVLAPHAPGIEIRETIENVSVERFRYLWPVTAQTICYQGGALFNLRRNRWNVLRLPPLVFFEWLAVVRRLTLRKYDLVHSHWILPQAFVAALSAAPLSIPHVVTVHGSDVFSLNGRLMTQLKKRALRWADAVTVNSSATCTAVMRIAPELRELHRIPMGASDHRLPQDSVVNKLRTRHRIGSGPLLAFVGRIIEQKGVADLIRAVALLLPLHPNTTAIIVGDGPDRPAMEGLVSKLGLNDRIAFTGSVTPDDVPNYLAAADVFVGPSKRAPDGSTEGQGLTFIEAMLCRTPVIATRVGGIIDAVRSEETGLMVSEGAPNEIADAVQRLLADGDLAKRLRENGFALARQSFTRTATARAFSTLFERLLSTRHGNSV